MKTLYITDQEEGGITILTLVDDDEAGLALAQNLYELSRTTDLVSRFDPVIHTSKAIAAGINGHRPQILLGRCTEADLPDSRTYRDAWRWVSDESSDSLAGKIVIDSEKAKEIDKGN